MLKPPDQSRKTVALVPQDILTQYLAVNFVGNTKSSNVLPALHEIYTNFGYPKIHITDNGLSLNSNKIYIFLTT